MALTTLLLCAGSAVAAGSAYAQWSLGAGGGSMTVPVTGFPAASVTTDSSSVQTPSGASVYLNASTPFGAVFGSSRNEPYALLRTKSGIGAAGASTTTITFATPPAAESWGFTLGDIDADAAQVSATGANGQVLSVADLGFQSTFNFCQGSPLPSTCGGHTDTDLPVWNGVAGTLTGNVTDTNGASGWFRPTVPIKSLTIKYSGQTGIPVYQLWVAALSRTISGKVTAVGGCDLPSGTTLRLLNSDGSAVMSGGAPVTTTVESDGTYSFAGVAAGSFKVALTPPSGLRPLSSLSQPADATSGDVADVDFSLRCTTPPMTPIRLPSPPPIVVPEDGPVDIPLIREADPAHKIEIVVPPAHGSVVEPANNEVLRYTPEPGYTGADSFTYEAKTKGGGLAEVTIRLKVVAQLPATGSDNTDLLLELGAGFLLAGAALRFAARRRKS